MACSQKEPPVSCGCQSVTALLQKAKGRAQAPPYEVAIPGEIDAPAFGLRLRVEFRGSAAAGATQNGRSKPGILRNWKPGDRVTLRHSSGPRKVKEVLERLRVTGTDRVLWPVLEVGGQIVWMRGVELEHDPRLTISADLAASSVAEPVAQLSPKDHGDPNGS